MSPRRELPPYSSVPVVLLRSSDQLGDLNELAHRTGLRLLGCFVEVAAKDAIEHDLENHETSAPRRFFDQYFFSRTSCRPPKGQRKFTMLCCLAFINELLRPDCLVGLNAAATCNHCNEFQRQDILQVGNQMTAFRENVFIAGEESRASSFIVNRPNRRPP